MEKYHQELEIKPTTQQPVHSEVGSTMLDGILGPATILFLSDRGKRDLGLWAGTHIREEETRKIIPVMKPETRDKARMTPG